tara:strand:- start:258 stop:518 length:261 start_codon:yes stop_codon:yes gene_type:complete
MKKLLEIIKSLNTSQAIVIAAVIISITYVVSNNFYKVTDIFCGEDCKDEKLSLSKNCTRIVSRNSRGSTTAIIKNDMYKKCLEARK